MRENALVGNAADREQVKTAKRKERDKRLDAANAMRAVLATREGRLIIWEHLAWCGVNRSVFAGNDPQTNYNAGRQDAGHRMLACVVDARPEAFIEMMQEAQKETA